MFHLFESILPRSFGARLAACFALLGAALGLVLAIVLGSMLAHNSRVQAGGQLQTMAANSARLLAEGLALRLREVEILSQSPLLWSEGLDSARVAQTLHRTQALNPFIAWIGVTDAQGVVRFGTGGMLLGASVSERPWFQAAREGLHVGDVHPAKLLAKLLPPASDGGPQRFVDFAAPIRQQGRLAGVLGMHGSWEWTRTTIESLLPLPSQRLGVEVFVFDRAGKMIYAPDGGLAGHLAKGQALPALEPTKAEAGTAAQVVAWQDGDDHLTAGARLPSHCGVCDLGWTVVARQPVSTAHATAREGAAAALLLGLVGAGLAAVCGIWMARRLTRPLRHIAQDAQALQHAAVLQELPARHGSLEIEQLSSALGGMTRRLLQANAELELRVQARTAELQQANAALAQMAHHDPLTGLLNRRGLAEHIAGVIASARRRQAPVSLLVVDADHFKQINDHLGHDVGDQVLKAIAQTLRHRLRDMDLVARVGGEEFVVVLPDTGSLGASHVADALLEAVRQAAMPSDRAVTVSLGVAEMALDCETLDDTLRRADAALYQAKHRGRNRHCVADRAALAVAVAVAA